MKRTPQAAILGAGPSGLMAAHAAERAGYDVTLFDRDVRPPDGRTAGVFYLHDHCDLTGLPCTLVPVTSMGSASYYRQRVYGPDYAGHTSFPEQSYFVHVWDGMAALAMLWKRFRDRVIAQSFVDMDDVAAVALYQEVVINTIPLDVLMPTLDFPYQGAVVATCQLDASELPYVIYSGTEHTLWYRASSIFGRVTLEYSNSALWNIGINAISDGWNIRHVRKVMPLPDGKPFSIPRERNILFTGRYGSWNKRMLTHNVYSHVSDWLAGRSYVG